MPGRKVSVSGQGTRPGYCERPQYDPDKRCEGFGRSVTASDASRNWRADCDTERRTLSPIAAVIERKLR